jgi:hypothetical protein
MSVMKFVLLALCVAVSTAQTRPDIAETFESKTMVEFHDPTGTFFGEGLWAIDYTNNRGIENYTLSEGGGRVRRVEVLQLYDKGVVYDINSYEPNHCFHRPVTGHIPSVFGFLQNATYRGQEKFREREYDMWGINAGGFEVDVGVEPDDPHRPYLLRRRHAGDESFYFFVTFNATTPSANDFVIPSDCRE